MKRVIYNTYYIDMLIRLRDLCETRLKRATLPRERKKLKTELQLRNNQLDKALDFQSDIITIINNDREYLAEAKLVTGEFIPLRYLQIL